MELYELKKIILKDMLRNKTRMEELIEINREDIISINISLNVKDGETQKLVNVKPCLIEPVINGVYYNLLNTSKMNYLNMEEIFNNMEEIFNNREQD